MAGLVKRYKKDTTNLQAVALSRFITAEAGVILNPPSLLKNERNANLFHQVCP